MGCGNIKCSANLELVRDLLLQLEECKSMGLNGIHPMLLQELSDVLVSLEMSFSQLFFSSLCNLESGLEADKHCNF